MKYIYKLFFVTVCLTFIAGISNAQSRAGKKNTAPEIKSLLLDGKAEGSRIRLNPQEKYMIKVLATDPDADLLTMRWELFAEDQSETGDEKPNPIADSVSPISKSSAMLHVPVAEGLYKLWLHVDDGKGHATKSSITFTVLPN